MGLRTRFQGIRSIFARGDFRKLAAAQVIGGLGEWLATLALIALVWDRTHSAFASGMVLALRILPAAVIGSFLSAVVDRFDRRRVLIATTAVRGCIYGSLPLVGGIGPVLGLALAAEVATLAYMAARDAALPRLVPSESLATANAVSMGTSFAAMPLGSGVFAGLAALQAALGRPGVGLSLFVSAGLLGWATILLGRMAAVAGVPAAPAPSSDGGTEPGGSLRALLRADPVLRRVVAGAVVAACCGGVLLTVGLAYVRGTLHAGPAAYSGLLTSFCFGAVAGIGALQRARHRMASVFHLAVGTMGGILVLMALFPSTTVGYLMGFGFGAAFVATFLGGVTILQQRVHDHVRGRAFALAHSGLRVGAVAVGLVAAWVAKRLGTASVVWTLDGTQVVLGAAGAALLAAALVLVRPTAARARS